MTHDNEVEHDPLVSRDELCAYHGCDQRHTTERRGQTGIRIGYCPGHADFAHWVFGPAAEQEAA